MFAEHSGMILRDIHIALFAVNWQPKVENLKRLSKQFGIGLDSMVFIDDSKHEIEHVQAYLPEVSTVLFHPHKIILHSQISA